MGTLKQSIAGTKQEIIAPIVWIGSQEINVAQLMIDTLDIVKELAELTANHSHSNTGMPMLLKARLVNQMAWKKSMSQLLVEILN